MQQLNPGDYSSKRKGFISVDGGEIYYEVKGTGPSLVLIHSAISDSRLWDQEFEFLSRNFTTIRYDVRGLGRSAPAVEEYSDSSDLKILLASLGVAKASIIACSNSGRIAMDFALMFPERVENMILVGSGLGLFEPEEADGLAQAVSNLEGVFSRLSENYRNDEKDKSVEELMNLLGSGLRGEARDSAWNMVKENLEEIVTDKSASHAHFMINKGNLKDITSRVLVLVGEMDNPMIIWSSRRLAEGIPGADFAILPKGDHFLNLSAGDEFIKAVGKLLGF